MEKDVVQIYLRHEKESLERVSGKKSKLGVSSGEIRSDIHELMDMNDGKPLLMAALVKAIGVNHEIPKEKWNQLRIKIVGAVTRKLSDFEKIKQDNAIWVKKKE
jgi:NADH:ubiquinone oxidoreductase subunit D